MHSAFPASRAAQAATGCGLLLAPKVALRWVQAVPEAFSIDTLMPSVAATVVPAGGTAVTDT
ncbi:hypothetical protein N7U49_24855 [Streptomyces sp. AD2-2]|nr:hypothetical protein N7U49_24855 [Streptomyces sp. AD2-2]